MTIAPERLSPITGHRDAADILRTVLGAVKYIHDSGIVHRDLKPENLLFRTKAEDAELLIADFGLSRVIDDKKHIVLTEVCGTPGVRSPCILTYGVSSEFAHSFPIVYGTRNFQKKSV